MKKRITAIIISALMLISMIPLASAETVIVPLPDDPPQIIKPFYPNVDLGDGYNSTISGESIFSAMMDPSEPNSFKDDTVTPYGTQKDEEFTLLENAEIFEYVSNANKGVNSATIRDNIQPSPLNTFTEDEKNVDLGDLGFKNLYFAQGVAFDPTGSGYRDHVAIVGISNDGVNSNNKGIASFHLYILDVNNNVVKHIQYKDAGEERYYALLQGLNLVDSNNMIQITAGDYNGDGSDSLVFCEGRYMFQVSYSVNTGNYTSTRISGSSAYIHDAYKNSGISGSWMTANQLCMSLASGDLNGDGIDDLAVLSYTGEITSNYINGNDGTLYNTTCIPQLSVGYGKRNTTLISDLSVDKVSVGEKASDSVTTNTMAFPSVAIGDIDGDGRNEIITAGYYNQSTASNPVNVNDDKGAQRIAYASYRTSGAGTLERIGDIRRLDESETSPIAMNDSLRENEALFQQLSVECVALDGLNTQEYVFLSGYFYTLDGTGKLQSISGNGTKYVEYNGLEGHVKNPFYELTTEIDGKDVDEVFIHSASVGNIFNSKTGEEAILLVIGYKTTTHNSTDEESSYYFRPVVFWKNPNDKQCPYFNEIERSGAYNWMMKKLNNSDSSEFISGSDGPSGLLIAVDSGTDSVVAKYSGKAFAYTDPTPVAFLQAAPYYSELEAGNSSTQYSYSEGYRVSNGTSTEISYDVGFAAEIEAGPIKTSMEAGIAYELNQEFVESIDKTYTTTFEANDQNQVILRQTLMYYYAYDLKVGDEFVKNALIVSAPQYPVLTSVSMDQYNEIAAAYNKMVDESTDSNVDKSHKLDLITDELKEKYFLNNEGNPFAYATDAYDYNNNGIPGWDLSQAEVGDTDTWMKLSHAGGTQTQTYSVTLEEEKTKSVADGCYTNMTVMAGGGSDLLNFSAYAGVSAGFERLDGSSISTASMTSTETSGTVQNLSGDLTNYGFTWKLIGWKTTDLFAGVPFVGYAVKNQTDLPIPVDDLKAEYSNGKVTLTFTAPETGTGRMATTHFYAYDDQHDRYIGACSNSSTNPNRSITIDVSEYTTQGATFTIVPYNENLNMKGMPSNEVLCLFVMSDKNVNALVQDLRDKIAALETALEAEDAELAAAIEDLVEAYEALSAEMEDLKEAQDVLSETMEQADAALQAAIEQVNKDLSDAIDKVKEELSDAIDQVNSDLSDAIDQVNENLDKVNSELSDSIDQVNENLDKVNSELSDSIDQVNENLSDAIDQVNENLSDAIDQVNKDLSDDIADLTDAYLAADALLKADIDSLDGKLGDLEQTMSEADAVMKAAIDKVNADLTAAIESLRSATEDALEQAIADLTEAYLTADALLKAENDALAENLVALGQTVLEADNALQTTIEKVESDLAAAKRELGSAMAADVDSINARIDTLNSALEAAYKLADEMLKKDIESLAQRLDELAAKHQEDIDDLRAELEALKTLIAEQDGVNGTQQETMNVTRTIAIIGTCVGGASLIGNVALLLLLLRKKSPV